MQGTVVPALVAACLLAAVPAAAHAIIIAARPDVQSTVAGPEFAIDLRFNARIDHRRSRLWLTADGGGAIAVRIAPGGPADHLTSSVSVEMPGDYVLHWQVLAIDGHITRGDIPFHVATH